MAKDDWKAKAAFMRDAGASHAIWTDDGALSSLVLFPSSAPRVLGPAQRLASTLPEGLVAGAVKGTMTGVLSAAQRHHDTLFAASSVKPPYSPAPVPESAVPRAVRAKEAAARGEKASSKR